MRVDTPDIYEDLKRRLMNATLTPGHKLKPSDLQGDYGCSANTVREVLHRLVTIGLVEFEAQRGFRVRAVDQSTFNDVTKFRILLEQEGAERSMEKGGVAWEMQLNAAHHALVHIQTRILKTGDMEPYRALWSEAERHFHETLISACGSALIRRTHANIYLQFRQQMMTLTEEFGETYFGMIAAEHQQILDAALARDAAGCALAIDTHLRRNIREAA